MSLNKAMIIGYVGRDPESRFTKSGAQVCSFSVATSEKFKDKEQTEWHNVTVWGKTAAFCEEYVKKGREIYVEGRLETRSWEKDGQKHYATQINAQVVKFVGPKQQGEVYGGKETQQREDETDQDIPF